MDPMIARLKRRARRRLKPADCKETYTQQVLEARENPVYLEIGVRDGDSFRAVTADRKIGVDPYEHKSMTKLRDGEQFFNKPSDDFFAEDAGTVLRDRRVDVGLVDGLHWFQQALRDVLNIERYSAPGGVILLDDMNPKTKELQDVFVQGKAWNGDVWKIGAYIQVERPDLEFYTIDADQGIGVIGNLNPNAPWPSDDVLKKYEKLTYDYLDANRSEILQLRTQSATHSV
ncbi:class I SAM-dependent methyltransferase [Flexivirga meconopsidis]|uniref:class I SAM-dependent methyltransferase n=1 Tax=Flexivirga meconopsidis TaxID=2977121 RepID=UPI00223F7104|nr:class I SAM-dependent methyltransferase [Flexivirga meconopsidis]